MKNFLAQTRKAVGVAAVGVYFWAQDVVSSSAHGVTTHEWLNLGKVGLAVLAAYGLTNALTDTEAA